MVAIIFPKAPKAISIISICTPADGPSIASCGANSISTTPSIASRDRYIKKMIETNKNV